MEDPELTPMPTARPVVLTIAGFDPSAGAGIAADLKVFAAHGLYGVAAITALTVQSTQGVRRVAPVEPQILAETLDCLAADVEIAGVKIGMLGTAEIVAITAGFLARAKISRERVVLDPVIRSSSGRSLLDAAGLDRLQGELLPHVGWITPNLDELAELAGRQGTAVARESIPEITRQFASLHPGLSLVVTGGHLDPPDDFLRTAEGEEHWFSGEKIETAATHGTGCTFSSALLCELVKGATPREAVARAKGYVRSAMEAAYPVGKGRGPLNHLFRLGPG
jgi:hydroxymethylpyrimidine/phosphomethylpyrimidine kinase